MPEGIALDAGRRVRDQDLTTDALAERFVQRRLVERGGGRQQGRVDALAGCRCDAQELLGRFGQVGRPGQEHVAQRGGQLGPTILAGRDEQLLAKECVATAPGMDRLDERHVQVVAGDRAELLARLAPVERHEREPFHATGPLELGQERQQRMAAVELVRAVREQEHHRDIAQVPDEEPEQVPGRAVGPMQVLDDEHDRRPRRQALEDAEEQLEQAALARAVAEGTGRAPAGSGHRPEVGDQPGQLGATLAEDDVELFRVGSADEPAQGFGDRGVRHRALAEVDAAADQHDGALGLRDRGDLGDDPRLADTSLTGQQRRAAVSLVGRLQGRAQSADLAGSADEDWAGDADRHGVDYHAGHGVPSPDKRRDLGSVRSVTRPRSRGRAGARSRTACWRSSAGWAPGSTAPERRSRRRSASSRIFCRRASANTSAL